jgi:clathrin heavy chain
MNETEKELIEEIEKLNPNIINKTYFNLENILYEVNKIILENSTKNLPLFLQIFKKYSKIITTKKIIPLFCELEGKIELNQFIEETTKLELFELQSLFIIKTKNSDLLDKIFQEDNKIRTSIVSSIIENILFLQVEEIPLVIKCFMSNSLANELILLLEKLLFSDSEFNKNKNLQNLLIFTCIKNNNDVKNYLIKLENYDVDIGSFLVEKNLFEEAILVYKKFKCYSKVVEILLNKIGDVLRAREFAESVNDLECINLVNTFRSN